jgi:predicted hydrocarbon binding protein
MAKANSLPSRMGRVLTLAMEEILGLEEAEKIVHLAGLARGKGGTSGSRSGKPFSFEVISRLQTALESSYGTRAGRGLSMRVGRACVKYGLREYGSELGIPSLDFRLLPLPRRIKAGSEALAGLLNREADMQVNLLWDENTITWQIGRCPLCWERQVESPCCGMAVGLLQEAMYWVSASRNYLVEEKQCTARGDPACTIVIDRSPLPE